MESNLCGVRFKDREGKRTYIHSRFDWPVASSWWKGRASRTYNEYSIFYRYRGWYGKYGKVSAERQLDVDADNLPDDSSMDCRPHQT